ncbi:hypothetical protein [Tsuneonella sp. HG222]
MRNFLFAGAAAIALAAVPAIGQETAPVAQAAAPGSYTMSTDQQTMYDGWPAEQQTIYLDWSPEYQTYFWTLTPAQQRGYWALTDEQRTQVYEMTPEQRTVAWRAIEAQLAGATPATPAGQANPPGTGVPTTGVPAPQSASQDVRPAMPADPAYQGGPYKGALTPPPATAMNKDYPVCTAKMQDNCQNSGEGGAPGRSRALSYWPGKPASES